MMQPTINLTKRIRRRKLRSGKVVEQPRYVLNFKEPKTGKRRQEFFEHQKAAQARRAELTIAFSEGSYLHKDKIPTVAEASENWLRDKQGKVKPMTIEGAGYVVAHIVGPIMVGTPQERAEYTRTGKKPAGAHFLPMLGKMKISDLTTGDIRAWHRQVSEQAGVYTANRAKSHLKSVLALAEEDHGVRAPSMPTGLGRTRQKARKPILTAEQIAKVIAAARDEPARYLSSAFLFLTGVRPSEMLGLLWDEVDFEANVIRIRHVQERDGSLTYMTKTMAGTRDIPLSGVLRGLLMEWKIQSPSARTGNRVFPGPGRKGPWPEGRRQGGGGSLLYSNWRCRFWAPIFKSLDLPYVTPHSARHSFISVLQARGVEVGLVAKLAGHANPAITLSHYTHATRGGEEAVAALEEAYDL